jgi:hypothetical protein
MRDGKERNLVLTLKNSAGNTDIVKNTITDKLGIDLAAVESKKLKEYGIDGGIEIKAINDGLISDQTTIKKGFIIIRANNKAVKTVEDFNKAVENSGNSMVLEGIYPGYEGVYQYAINDLRSEP